MATWKTNVLQVSAGPVHELPCLGNSPVCLELKMKTIQFSARKDLILDAVFHSLKDNGIDGLKREEILQLTREAVEKVMKHDTWLPSWALKTMGATIDVERTSKSYGGNRWLSPFFSSAKPPETILQPDISAGNCWAFQGSRGHVVIRLPEKIWPTAFTIWHISKAVSPSGEVSTAPREFVVSGVDEDEGEALLGSFIYDVDGEIAQTFQCRYGKCLQQNAREEGRAACKSWEERVCLITQAFLCSPTRPTPAGLTDEVAVPPLEALFLPGTEREQQQEGGAGGKLSPCGRGETNAGGEEDAAAFPHQHRRPGVPRQAGEQSRATRRSAAGKGSSVDVLRLFPRA
eukprot:XP_025003513.1 SUN domain-containing protein 3-like [Gallus gallus]